MPRLLRALPLLLLPFTSAQAEEVAHASLGAHEHGAAHLDVALDSNTLELALESPAMNLVGFEHAAASASDQAAVAAARQQLAEPLQLFRIPTEAGCAVTQQELQSPLFALPGTDAATAHEHSDVDAHYTLTCAHPEQLRELDLGTLFQRFAAMQKIQVQLIGPNGQQGAQLSAANPTLNF